MPASAPLPLLDEVRLQAEVAEIGGADVELKRIRIIMQGTPCCDFRYRFK
ncbi:MAG: hypothetical protein U1E60_16410 [Reyranellaceae bacterium]